MFVVLCMANYIAICIILVIMNEYNTIAINKCCSGGGIAMVIYVAVYKHTSTCF